MEKTQIFVISFFDLSSKKHREKTSRYTDQAKQEAKDGMPGYEVLTWYDAGKPSKKCDEYRKRLDEMFDKCSIVYVGSSYHQTMYSRRFIDKALEKGKFVIYKSTSRTRRKVRRMNERGEDVSKIMIA